MNTSPQPTASGSCPFVSLVTQNDMETIRNLLYSSVWDRFASDLDICNEKKFSENRASCYALPCWFLHASVFTGCPVLIEFALKAMQKETVSKTCERSDQDFNSSYKDLINTRLECRFPLPDTWVNQSFLISLSPLHLACWRLDYHTISLLLFYGGDSNLLALEVDVFCNPDYDKEANYKSSNSVNSSETACKNMRGLSPLHFLALGIRAPPNTSLLAGIETNVIHESKVCFEPDMGACDKLASQVVDPSNLDKFLSNRLQKDCQLIPDSCIDRSCSLDKYVCSDEHNTTLRATIINCVDALIKAKSNPNLYPNQNVLVGAGPLDIILQPPMRIYYAPTVARGNTTPTLLRQHDLVAKADSVLVASSALWRHGARLSPFFSELYSWKPGVLDCFHMRDSCQARELVKQVIRLGLFSYPVPLIVESERNSEGYQSNVSSENSDPTVIQTPPFFDPIIMRRFVANVVNTEISLFLASIVLQWCPNELLSLAEKETKAAIKRVSTRLRRENRAECQETDLQRLTDLAQIVRDMQLSSLRHRCAMLILESVDFKHEKIMSLPLPVPLKNSLVHMDL